MRAGGTKAEEIRGVALSHPEKPLWPASAGGPALAKRDLALYFEAVGEWMLPHVKGRPCSIIRAPDGVEGALFYQRHKMKGASGLIQEVKVAGEAKPYIEFNSVAAMIAGAQIAAIELHPWNCLPGDPETPGRLVFDIDPGPDVPFERVIEAAREVRDRLAELGLVGFCKTTGGKGLHVVAPLKASRTAPPGWEEAKAFARGLCARMVEDAPALYLIAMSKKARFGKIFLDYLRNDRTATAAAPLSPRARKGAPVSMPVAWTQVRAGLDPSRFNLRTAPALVRKLKAWEDYRDGERPLAPAARKLFAGRARR